VGRKGATFLPRGKGQRRFWHFGMIHKVGPLERQVEYQFNRKITNDYLPNEFQKKRSPLSGGDLEEGLDDNVFVNSTLGRGHQ
jgi:hypothetical protein